MKLAAVSAELMHAACQNAVPGFRRVDLEDRDRVEAVPSVRAEGFKSLDRLTFSRKDNALALPVQGDALAGRTSGLQCSENLEATSVVQSIGCPHKWRLSDAGVGSVPGLQPLLASVMAGGEDRFVGAHPGAMGRPGRAPRAQVRSYSGVGDCAWFTACRRIAGHVVGAHPGAVGRPGRAPRAQVRSYSGVGDCAWFTACRRIAGHVVGAHPGAVGRPGRAFAPGCAPTGCVCWRASLS
ncbi:hypothetical protein XaplCFBP3122_00160 [Xanthomonas arboricola pv. populi]|uniref:Uncharacterized protein n=1 Tax=Xanthomonas arboricola pv. populi TaxID=487823 RepID=A0A2S6Z9C4_9XANT|nr:hypothetical protein XaplCFBP3122_00160 [Xanthomonas arboricola pv. populi]